MAQGTACEDETRGPDMVLRYLSCGASRVVAESCGAFLLPRVYLYLPDRGGVASYQSRKSPTGIDWDCRDDMTSGTKMCPGCW